MTEAEFKLGLWEVKDLEDLVETCLAHVAEGRYGEDEVLEGILVAMRKIISNAKEEVSRGRRPDLRAFENERANLESWVINGRLRDRCTVADRELLMRGVLRDFRKRFENSNEAP